MPVEVAIWNVTDSSVEKIGYSAISSEKKLEDVLAKDISILGDAYLTVGRQVQTSFGKFIDLLAIDADGKLSVIELKRSRTPRDVVAQALDYASWVQNLSYKEIVQIFRDSCGKDFEPAFEETFGVSPPERLNQEHDIVIVCSELDNETERIINYNVPINAVFFRFFKDGESEYLSRSWLIDPSEVEEKSSKTKVQSKSEVWNGRDFVVNIDVSENISSWEDAVKYGFVSAGGGEWYSRTLSQLFPGARIFAMRPKVGYLGVGIVKEKRTPINDFMVETDSGALEPILNVELKASGLKNDSDNPSLCEYFVRVDWIKTVKEEEAYWEKGLSANQNSAFKLKNRFTLDKLIQFFAVDE